MYAIHSIVSTPDLANNHQTTDTIFFSRDALHKHGLCRRAVSVRPSRSCIVTKRAKGTATVAMEVELESNSPKASNDTIVMTLSYL